MTTWWSTAAAVVFVCANVATAEVVRIEPDDYADYADLSNPYPGITLWVLRSDRTRIESFAVRAREGSAGYASTGTKVFAHEGVAFFNDIRQLRINFAGGVSSVSADFIGGRSIGTEIGRLEAFDAAGNLLASDVTQPLGPQIVETLDVSRATPDIAYAIIYSRPDEGSFGVVDNLVVNVVPEPASAALLVAGASLLLWRRNRSTAGSATPRRM